MRVFQRGKVYWFELVFKGRRIQKSTRSTNQRTAGQIASTYHAALIKGEVGIVERSPVPRFAAAMAAFLTWSTQEHTAHPGTAARSRHSSKALLRFFRDVSLDKILPEDVERFKKVRSGQKAPQSKQRLRPATVNRELACLREMFNHTIKGCPELRNPVSKVKFLDEQNLQERVLTWAEQRAYLEAASPVLRDFATVILETGMRPDEVFTLRRENIDAGGLFLRVFRGKTKAAKRRIDLNPAAREVIDRRVQACAADGNQHSRQEYLFPGRRGRVGSHLKSIQTAHGIALRKSNVRPFRPYDMRHTWATRAAEGGTDLVTLAAMMGHSRIQMVLRYAHPSQDHQSSAAAKLFEHNLARERQERARAETADGRRSESGLHAVPRRQREAM